MNLKKNDVLNNNEGITRGEIMKIHEQDLITFLEKYNFNKKLKIKLSKKFVLKLSQHDRLCFIALVNFQYCRNIEKSINNANIQYPVQDKDILLFFLKMSITEAMKFNNNI